MIPRWWAALAGVAMLMVAPSCQDAESYPRAVPMDACASLSRGGHLRAFAVQPRFGKPPATYEEFARFLVEPVEREVVPLLSPSVVNLIVMAEYTGLPAAFLGSRGVAARASQDSISAFVALQKPYAQQAAYYTQRFGTLSFQESIVLPITDTSWRAFHLTLSDLARRTGSWVLGSTLAPLSLKESQDPADIDALADPDGPRPPSVYVATDRRFANTSYLYDPRGEIVHTFRKPYPTPLEEDTLAVSPGALRDIEAGSICGTELGIFISKDAWMPDVVERQALDGARLFLQPEAFSGWTTEQVPGDWLPSIFQQSAWSATQKHEAYRAAVVPHVTGNLFDLSFDGQSAIFVDATPGQLTQRAYVGLAPMGGVAAIAPWTIDDPGWSQPSLPLAERRAQLRAVGEQMLPGGPRASDHRTAVLAANLDPLAPYPILEGTAGASGGSQPLPAPVGAEQHRPALVASDSVALLAYEQTDALASPALGSLRIARSDDGGASFGEPRPLAAASAGAQRSVALLMAGDSVYAAWQERAGTESSIWVARSGDGGASFGPARKVSTSGDAWLPALAATGSRVLVTFIDNREGNERVVLARAALGTVDFESALPLDPQPPAKAAGNIRNNQWSPSLVAQGEQVAAMWVDFRGYNWDVWLARSSDGGTTFSPAQRVDDGLTVRERVHSDTSLLMLTPGQVVAGWTDVRMPDQTATARFSRDAQGESKRLGAAPDGSYAYRPRFAALSSGRVAAVWQDNRTLGNDVYLALSDDQGASFGAERRVDDGGEGPSYQFAPVVAASRERLLVAWEDTRSGRPAIRWRQLTP